ncbi:MAG: aldo/keto reductase [Lachnospiraceae bacterium]|nr:aldo/keto reductase [Lachnospiraceae bacterium]
MQYRKDKYGKEISALGYGCMRFTRKGSGIDLEKAEQELMAAFQAGVNYYDTAYIYPGSEVALGEIVKRGGIREQISIATKLPQYLIGSTSQIEKYFREQLTRLQTDYIDYYLMHMLTDIASWHKLKDLGILKWIEDKKAAGTIRNLGFSFHGDTEMFLQILNDYDWDFCQIQYNYLDETTQAGRRGLEAAYEKGIPVIIMEPLRGGKLVNLLPERAKKLIAEDEHHWSAAEWALRWLWDQPGVTCILSGMNSVEMVEENCRIASEALSGSFTAREQQTIGELRNIIQANVKVGCTGCRYCMPCPKGVDIPGLFQCYNKIYTENLRDARHEYAQVIGLRKEPAFATQCVNCGKCESHCPQHIEIRKMIKAADKELRPFYYRIGLNIARKFIMRGKRSGGNGVE